MLLLALPAPLLPSLVNAEAHAAKPSPEKQWWLRTLAICQAPRPVFAALRDVAAPGGGAAGADPRDHRPRGDRGCCSPRDRADPRRESSTTASPSSRCPSSSGAPSTASLLDRGRPPLRRPARSGSEGSYRRARHILAFAAVPRCSGCAGLAGPARSSTAPTRSARAVTTPARSAAVRPRRRRVRPLVARAADLRDRRRRALAATARGRRPGAPGARASHLHGRDRGSAVESLRRAQPS